MLDINSMIKQEDSNHKINLLKKIKISIESLVFDASLTSNRSSWQSQGVMSILSRHILSILEDDLIMNDQNLSVSCSPINNYKSPSRSTTISSIGTVELTSNSEMDQVIWTFVLYVFYNDSNELKENDLAAKKDFEAIFSQLKDNNDHITLDWITLSLKQNVLLNQLVYLFNDKSIIEKFYRSNAFILDRLYLTDFLNYIKACETRDYTILKKIKCKFFSPNHQINKSPIIDKTNTRSSTNTSSSHASSFNSQNNQYIAPINDLSDSSTSIAANSANNTDSIIELAINEINLNNKMKHTHRRMHSFPNIQINEAKRKAIANSNIESSSRNQSFNSAKLSIEAKDTGSLASPKIEESAMENQLSTSTTMLNNQIDILLQKENDSTSSNLHNIYQKTTVFDFIHSQQINCDCNQVDKENSHFIIADVSIAAFELIKTQDLDELDQLDKDSTKLDESVFNVNFLTVNRMKSKKQTRLISNGIKINSFKSKDSSSQLNSFQSISPLANGTMFSSDDYASSVEREVFLTSGCVSPSNDVLSTSSAIIDPAQIQPRRGHKKSLSLVTKSVESANEPKKIFKSVSSSNLQLKEIQEHTAPSWQTENQPPQVIFKITDDTVTQDKNISLSSSPVLPSNPTVINALNRNLSSATVNSETSSRTRRFSWEEIINLDTAEHIANRLIEKLVDNENQRKKLVELNGKRVSQPAQIPNLKQFEIFLQLLEFYEYMQAYYELRCSGALQKYINTFNSKPTMHNSISKNFIKSIQSKPSMISKIKIAAVAAAAAVSMRHLNLEQQKNKLNETKTDDEEDIENTNNLLKQIALNIQDSISIDTLSQSKGITLNLDNTSIADFNDLEKSITSKSSSLALSNNFKTFNSRILGDESWAPVRDQLILNQTPKPKRLDQMIQQNFRCADCGIQVRKDKMKSFNYCEYYCKYFCRCCHINYQSYIPAYIVNSLDFKTKYEVSKKAKNFLEKIYSEPVITLESLNPSLFERANIFSKLKKVRCKLYNCRHYINTCRFAIDLKKQLFNQFDDFIINDQMVYSIETLFKVKQTNYYEILKNLVNKCIDHIKSCELCSQQGYICGLCTNNELLYPFDLDKVQKCENCLACCHKNCLKKPEFCPRCKRKQNRIRLGSTSGTISIAND